MSKSHPEIFNIFFIFQNKSSTRAGGLGVEPSFVGNESDGHKMCFSEPRGLFYILWHEDTERKPSSLSLTGLPTCQPGPQCRPPFLSWGLSSYQKRWVLCCF